ncbi:fibronectin type III domain-containing protein [Paenibacillus koleovorans]|uniref:fibronectin type III domain-containing protein n=1 Tax=Paenibacillus koleovorans TaxID=121608 RepID=UPI000FD72EFA|nr:fibronectin type III domain-containing protein [Paenibacillus koleovorans]
MKQTVIELHEHLHHRKYNWPHTVVNYSLQANAVATNDKDWRLLDTDGRSIPYQWARDGEQTTLSFITDLPAGAKRLFTLCEGEAVDTSVTERRTDVAGNLQVYSDKDGVVADNGLLSVAIPRLQTGGSHPLFVLTKPGAAPRGVATLRTNRKIVEVSSECLAAGPVFYAHRLTYQLESGASYTVTLRLADAMEYAELQETITGLSADDETKLVIEWQSFVPRRRYTQNRGYEKVDQFVEEGGQLPILLLPYQRDGNWQHTKTAVFADQEHSAALFVKNIETWDDGEFAIWGSSPTLAVRFMRDGEGAVRWEYALSTGTRSTAITLYEVGKDSVSHHDAHVNDLWLWQEYLSLDKVKDWVLDWPEPREAYPRFFRNDCLPAGTVSSWFFRREQHPAPDDMEAIMDKLSFCLNQIYQMSPVAAREFFSWVPFFDLSAPAMTQAQFDRCKAVCAFMAYASNDENQMPVRHMLAGHPNFLVDMKSVAGQMAALLPNHPHARVWKDQFERAMALNLKYHVRPDVPAWDAEGGRHTENLACYTLANLHALMKPVKLIRKQWGEHPTLYPAYTSWLRWLLHALTAPVDGSRHYPSQGAHAGSHVDDYRAPLTLRTVGEELARFDPLLAEYLLHVCPANRRSFEEKRFGTDIWRGMPSASPSLLTGTRPPLGSKKYTGYGFVLRAAVGTKAEISVHLQQIDEGPNYRWGRAAEGGNGNIYYYAGNKRYSFNRKEDVGDANMGDVQASCNFGVLSGHEFCSIGRNELTEPLYDLGFAQYATLLAGSQASPAYHSRSLMMSGHDYIVVYDQVGDLRVRGRFAWFVNERDDFPTIHQLKPGVPGYAVAPGIPAELGSGAFTSKNEESRGRYYDGNGHFLTLISHHAQADYGYLLSAKATEYGALVAMTDRKDMIFRDEAEIHYEEGGVVFSGYAGLVRLYGEHKAEAALFKGSRIGVGGVEVSVRVGSQNVERTYSGIGFTRDRDGVIGHYYSLGESVIELRLPATLHDASYHLYVDGAVVRDLRSIGDRKVSFQMPRGRHSWQWTNKLPRPETTQIGGYIASSGEAELSWEPASGADYYEVAISEDGGDTWPIAITDIRDPHYRLTGDNGTKRHVRVRGVNGANSGEWSHDYPLYYTGDVPAVPDGLRIQRLAVGFRVTWGWLLGASSYKLYRKAQSNATYICIYTGQENDFTDTQIDPGLTYEYCVAACNGNGEGEASPARDTAAGGLTDWDPLPDETFRRYTKSHEYGYQGFDHWANRDKPVLHYPPASEKRKEWI